MDGISNLSFEDSLTEVSLESKDSELGEKDLKLNETTSFSDTKSELKKLEIQNNSLIDDFTDEELDVSKLNLKKVGLNTLEIDELDFDDLDNSLVEIDEDNNLDVKNEVKNDLDQSSSIKKIVIDDNKNNVKKYSRDSKKNFSFFD